MKDLQLAPVIENLKAVTECVTADMMGRAWPEKSIRIVSVVIDEIFGNIVKHAVKSDAVTVREEFEEDPDALVLTFIDRNPPFDPLTRADPNVTLPAKKRKIGGLGIFMTKKLADHIDYEYKDGKNILRIKKYLK